MKRYNRVLTIAGSDSGGGAGIQADIKTISALGGYAASAITAVTVQNTLGVSGVHPIPIDVIRGQIDAVLEDIGADAVKIGMLHSAEVVAMIIERLDHYKIENIVVDPVMVSTSGHRLIEDSAVELLRDELLPRARIITPNIPEAEILLSTQINHQDQLEELAQRLSPNKTCSVLLKAGHLTEQTLTDIFYNAEESTTTQLSSQRSSTPNTHGTGCTLSSAVATCLALGMSPTDAVIAAKEYIRLAIISGADYSIGGGHGPVDHFHRLRK
ncbi:MAG: bifunctional hydroxymethylpyrimidine kinase/phosphomethylpyrimidine kinase [Rikenellaceae bacterium]